MAATNAVLPNAHAFSLHTLNSTKLGTETQVRDMSMYASHLPSVSIDVYTPY